LINISSFKRENGERRQIEALKLAIAVSKVNIKAYLKVEGELKG